MKKNRNSNWKFVTVLKLTPFSCIARHFFPIYFRTLSQFWVLSSFECDEFYYQYGLDDAHIYSADGVIEICIDSNYLELCSCRATDSKLTTILIAMKIYFHFNHSAKSCQNEQWNLITDFRTLKRGRNGKLSMELKVWWYISVISFISRNMLLYSCCSHRLLPQPNLKGPYKTWRSSMQRHQRFVGWTGSMELW